MCGGAEGGAGDPESTCEREANFDLFAISYLRITVQELFWLITCY